MYGIVIFFLFFVCQMIFCQDREERILATVIAFREGEHTPIHAFPEDPWTDEWEYMGYRVLTLQGKHRLFQLGKWLRERYVTLLPRRYNRNAIYVGSASSDEAITSAQMVLAGLYPPLEDQIFDKNIKWQPIPVHVDSEDYNNRTPDDEELKQMELILSQAIEEAQCDSDWLVHLYGVRIDPAASLYGILDAVMAAKGMNFTGRRTNEEVVGLLELVVMDQLEGFTTTAKLARWRLEPFLEALMNMFGKFVPTPPPQLCVRKFNTILYAAGLSTMVNIIHGMKSLGIVEILDRVPYFGSTLMLELKDGGSGKKFVNVFYRNSLGVLHQYPIHNCGLDCDLDRFVTMITDILNTKYEEEGPEYYRNYTG